ncbi:MAG: alpha-amylase [Planctomycetes bacterium]|nr:alpha-amylase [Planctomycetota bacterium]
MIADLEATLQQARVPQRIRVDLGGRVEEVARPFPSPPDWRDLWIYALLIDRFNNPRQPPRCPDWDRECDVFQGGTLEGVRAALDYLADLGVGAILLSPVLKNCQHDATAYHGYGPRDFLTIEPRFSSALAEARRDPSLAERELVDLVAAAHARGIYVLLDVVLHHAGDVFAYAGFGPVAPWREPPYPVHWRDESGRARRDWPEPPLDAHRDAAVWPAGLRRNVFFARRGNHFSLPDIASRPAGDFVQQKAWATDYREDGRFPVRDFLIDVYTYLVAKYDFDGFRIDTFKYLEDEFVRGFVRSIREFAASIGKTNFFMVGEIWDTEETIAAYLDPPLQRAKTNDMLRSEAIDGAFDYPLFYLLPEVLLGREAPVELVRFHEKRDKLYDGVSGSDRDPRWFFATFLDNHDQTHRYWRPDSVDQDSSIDQLTMAVACLFCWRGIPCLYYGTEQGLHGAGDRVEAVREALWGKPESFAASHAGARACCQVSRLRREHAALRRGHQVFRPISTDRIAFGFSCQPGGMLAFSRVLDDEDVLVAANCSDSTTWTGVVAVDGGLDQAGTRYDRLFTNRDLTGSSSTSIAAMRPRSEAAPGSAIAVVGGRTVLPLTLERSEVQILLRRAPPAATRAVSVPVA